MDDAPDPMQQDESSGVVKDEEPSGAASRQPKRPPPETPEDVRLRQRVIASFWIVVVLLGVPVWLWTTSIPRAGLPLEDMLAWADGRV